jgi:superfamily I DNA and/or RNA helicase
MHPTICEFVSKSFYEGELKTDITKARALDNAPANKLISWYNHHGDEFQQSTSSYENETEVRMIEGMFFDAVEYGIDHILYSRKSILVLTFYSAQLKLLQSELRPLAEDYNRDGNERMKIMTVDGSQGSEADLVSLTFILFLLPTLNTRVLMLQKT